MDQILHRKLIIEKNNLQLEVAKANKEVAKLMETVQQYEAVLSSLNEAEGKKLKSSIGSISKSSTIKIHPSVKPGFEKDGLEPNNVSGLKAKKLEPDFRPQPKQKPGKYERPAWLRSTEHHDAYFDPETNHVDTINTATGVRKWVHVDDLALTLPPRLRAMHEFEKPKLSTNTKVGVKLPAKNKSINKTLVRGMEAAKLKAQMSGKKLPTAAEAAKQTKKIEAEKELDQAGLGKLKKSRLSIMNRLGKKQEVQEGFKDFVKDMGSQLKTIGKDALANVKKDMGTMKAKVSPANIKAGVKALPGKIEAAAQKMPTQQQNIDFMKNKVVPMIGRVGAEMQRNAPKNVQKRNASINRMMKP
jgi:hypothetical protein